VFRATKEYKGNVLVANLIKQLQNELKKNKPVTTTDNTKTATTTTTLNIT